MDPAPGPIAALREGRDREHVRLSLDLLANIAVWGNDCRD
jgi:hypothetical protein